MGDAYTQVHIPDDQPLPEQATAPLAALSSEVDPMPHYVASAACAGGSAYAYSRMSNPRAAAIAGGFAAAYFFAG